MFLKLKRKSISPLIATILLVVVAVAIIGIVLSWGKGFANTSLSSADNISSKDTFSGLVWSFQTTGNNVLIENKSKQDLNITGYTINSLDHNGFWINSYHPLETTLSISPGTSNNVPLICMPEGKFILTLKTSNNENIPLNISPSKTLLGGTCEEYNVSLWEFASGTGSYKIEEIALAQGELVTNGGFDSDTDWGVQPGWEIENGTANCDGTNDARIYQNIGLVTNKYYKVTYNVNVINGGVSILPGGTTPIIISSSTENDLRSTIFRHSGNTYLYFRSYNFVGSIDNVSVTEIPPLPNFNTGTKYLENTTVGTTAIQSKQAYGTWEFDVYSGNSSNRNRNYFICNSMTPTNDSYSVETIGTGIIEINKNTGSKVILGSTASSYIANNTWYRIKVARLQSEGVFKDIPNSLSSLYENSGYTSFTSINNNHFSAISNGSGTQKVKSISDLSLILTQKYLVEFDLKLNSGTAPTVNMQHSSTGFVMTNSATSSNGRNSIVFTVGTTGVSDLVFTNNSTTSDYEVSGLTIRRIYPSDTFAVFIKGGSFGDNWTLVSTAGGSGTNPVTDSTYTTSNYFVADLDAGDRIANVKIKPNID